MTAVVDPSTSHRLTNAALPYLMLAAESRQVRALEQEATLFRGMVLFQGRLVHAEAIGALNREANNSSELEN